MTRFPALDTLRAFAILWVMTHHLRDLLRLRESQTVFGKFYAFGNAGVDLFFVLSGFLIASIILTEWKRTGCLNWPRFWMRRWMRTLPAYFATLLLLMAIYLFLPPKIIWPNWFSYLVFLQLYANNSDTIHFVWSWSLAVEEWFYLVLPLFFVGCRQILSRVSAETTLRVFAALAILVSIASRSWLYMQLLGGHLSDGELHWTSHLVTHYRLDGLAAGVYVSTLGRPAWSIALASAMFLALAALVALIVLPIHQWSETDRDFQLFEIHRPVFVAVIFGVLVHGSTGENAWSRLNIPGARFIADLSYSLYLLHPVAERVAAEYISKSSKEIRLVVFIVVAFVLSVLMRYLVEIPFLRLRDRLGARSKKIG